MKRLLWVLPVVLLLAACAGASGTTSSGGPAGQAGGGVADFAVAKPGSVVAAPAPAQSEIGTNGVPVPQAFDPTRSVILTANIAMKATDPWATAEKAQSVATD